MLDYVQNEKGIVVKQSAANFAMVGNGRKIPIIVASISARLTFQMKEVL